MQLVCAGGRVSRIGIRGLGWFLLLASQPGKVAIGNEDFTADFDAWRGRQGIGDGPLIAMDAVRIDDKPVRNAAHRADVVRDVGDVENFDAWHESDSGFSYEMQRGCFRSRLALEGEQDYAQKGRASFSFENETNTPP